MHLFASLLQYPLTILKDIAIAHKRKADWQIQEGTITLIGSWHDSSTIWELSLKIGIVKCKRTTYVCLWLIQATNMKYIQNGLVDTESISNWKSYMTRIWHSMWMTHRPSGFGGVHLYIDYRISYSIENCTKIKALLSNIKYLRQLICDEIQLNENKDNFNWKCIQFGGKTNTYYFFLRLEYCFHFFC